MSQDGFADLVRYLSDVVLSLAFITRYYFLPPIQEIMPLYSFSQLSHPHLPSLSRSRIITGR